MNYTTQNQTDVHYHETKGTDSVHAASELLDLFAEELPAQHDLMTSQTASSVSTLFCYGSTASSFSTVSPV